MKKLQMKLEQMSRSHFVRLTSNCVRTDKPLNAFRCWWSVNENSKNCFLTLTINRKFVEKIAQMITNFTGSKYFKFYSGFLNAQIENKIKNKIFSKKWLKLKFVSIGIYLKKKLNEIGNKGIIGQHYQLSHHFKNF